MRHTSRAVVKEQEVTGRLHRIYFGRGGRLFSVLLVLDQYPMNKAVKECLVKLRWPMRAAPAYPTTIISSSFHSPSSQKNGFNL
jgi:hypothetical protein